MTIWIHIAAVFAGLALPVLSAVQHSRGRREGSNPEPMAEHDKLAVFYGNAATTAVVTGLVLTAWWHGGRTLDELGLTTAPARIAPGAILVFATLAFFAIDAWSRIATKQRLEETLARWQRDTPFMPATARELRHSMAMIVAAAVGEEIVFRGFLIAYLITIFGSSSAGVIAAIAVPAMVFGICHLYQGYAAVVKVAIGAAMFGAILVVTGSLWIPMLLHFLIDLTGMLFGVTRPGLRSATRG